MVLIILRWLLSHYWPQSLPNYYRLRRQWKKWMVLWGNNTSDNICHILPCRGTKSDRCKKLSEFITPKATQPPQCKTALIKFAWEFPLQLKSEKIKCQDLDRGKISSVGSINLHKKGERTQSQGILDLPRLVRNQMSVSEKLIGQGRFRGATPKASENDQP